MRQCILGKEIELLRQEAHLHVNITNRPSLLLLPILIFLPMLPDELHHTLRRFDFLETSVGVVDLQWCERYIQGSLESYSRQKQRLNKQFGFLDRKIRDNQPD